MKSPRPSSLSNAQVQEFLSMVEDGSLFKWSLNYLKSYGKEEIQRFPPESQDQTHLDKELALRFEKLKASWAALEKHCPDEIGQQISGGGTDQGQHDVQTGKAENRSIFRNPVVQGKTLLLEVDAGSLPPDLAERFQALKQSDFTFASPSAQSDVNCPTKHPAEAAASKAQVPVFASAVEAAPSKGSVTSLISSVSFDAPPAATSRAKRKLSGRLPNATTGLPSISSTPSLSTSSSASSSGRSFTKPKQQSANASPKKKLDGSRKAQSSKKAVSTEENQKVLLFSLDDVEKFLESFTQEIISKQKEKLKETRFLHRLISSEDDLTFWSKEPTTSPASAGLPTSKQTTHKPTKNPVNYKEDSDSEEISPYFNQKQGLKVKSLKRWNFI